MSTKSITGTGLLLAVALLAQSLRLIFPFIPNTVSMFLIGTITSATFVLATWRYGWKNGLVIAWIAPVVAYLQGMLPVPPFILITGLGTTAYVFAVYWLQHKPKILLVVAGAIVKAGVLFGGYSIFFSLFSFPEKIVNTMLFVASWPQLVTSSLGIILALIVMKRARLSF
ncbi:ECF transporter S component [Veillonella rodentium]|uniref:ECF transporter S component n=1 Tax=Veillonella rodentium TaxID=248315 RepID=A0A239YFD2_9FIRM|nr:hypothetical protein [Veillonella rodentium]SNV57430.1 Uncharacterised protein [Veillonella rodentium]